MGWRAVEILAATGGKVLRDGGKTRFGEIVTDSTKVKTGSVFVALKGERHDGHRFVGDAVRRGAGCVIAHRSLPKSALGRATAIKVADTLTALGDLAHYRRQQFAPKVLAITGSNGKTTTKEMVAAILQEAWAGGKRRRGKILKTEGNFNNLVGLPLTLLRLRKQDKMAVVELGTNQPGEIQRLTEIADPDIGIITSVAAAHLEGLNSLAGVAREKGALYRGMLFVGGARVHHLLATALMALPLLIYVMTKAEYRLRRLMSFLDPWSDASGSGFHVIQSLIAFGSGQMWGRGLGESRQKLFYLPEAHTDFVYSVIGEELGLLGALVVLALFGVIIVRGLQLTARIEEPFDQYLAFGLTVLLGLQALIHMPTSSSITAAPRRTMCEG